MGKYFQGCFKPKNPCKYKGDPTNIIYRSSWEFRFMNWCDEHSEVLEWSSEEVVIPYVSPIDGRRHRYFPDFRIKIKTKDGTIKTLLIEIKPDKETKPPSVSKKLTKTGKLSRSYLREVETWGKNSAKWKAAKEYCDDRGYEFLVMTENHLGV